MKIIAKDYVNRGDLLSGVVDLTSKNSESLQLNIIGVASLRSPVDLRKISFRLLPKGMSLDIPEADVVEIEKIFWWEHVEIQIDSEALESVTKWLSYDSFRKIAEKWAMKEQLLLENGVNSDDVLYTKSISNHGSYSISREDLVILLGMNGKMTVRESILSFELPEDLVLDRILKALKHHLLSKSPYMKKISYPETIKAMGMRINMFYSNLKSWFGSSSFPQHSYFARELELLSTEYPDAECLAVSPDGIDVSESVISLSFSKDPEFVCSVGSRILKPLNMLFCNMVIGAAYEHSFDSILKVLNITDKGLKDAYRKLGNDELPPFLRSTDE